MINSSVTLLGAGFCNADLIYIILHNRYVVVDVGLVVTVILSVSAKSSRNFRGVPVWWTDGGYKDDRCHHCYCCCP